MSDPADAVLQVLDNVTVYFGSGAAAPSYSGLSIYFPPTSDLYALDVELWGSEYAESVPNSVGWIDLLETFYTAGDSIAETDFPAFVTEPVVTADASGITVEARLDPASVDNVSQATINYGIANDDGSTDYYGDEPATIADDGSGLVTGSYDRTVLNISDGTDTATAYITLNTTWRRDHVRRRRADAVLPARIGRRRSRPGHRAQHRPRSRRQRHRRDLLLRRHRHRHHR